MTMATWAGSASTIIFACSTMPMLIKAVRTKDLSSYSLGNILLSNVGNLIHSIYIFSLPAGPIWLLHSFYLVTTGLMLVWYLRYEAKGVDSMLPRRALQRIGVSLSQLSLRSGSEREVGGRARQTTPGYQHT